jgi:MFS family permease
MAKKEHKYISASAPAPGQVRIGLMILTLINLLNYLDRYVVSALVESLKKSELRLTDTQAGLLATGFIVVYMLTSPVFGALGDRGRRTLLIASGVGVWSIATALGGLAHSFASLFAARATVGIGEAAYGTISPGLLADYYPQDQRGRVFAVFFSAIPIGSALGFILGGLMDQHFGWRAAFYVAGIPGIFLALMVLPLPDPPRGIHDVDGGKDNHSLVSKGDLKSTWIVYRDLARNRPYRLTVLGYAAYTFAVGGMAFWMPTFLERVREVPKVTATVQFGSIVVVTGLVGTLAGGWLGDYLLKYSRHSYLWISGIATLAAVPLAWVALVVRSPALYLSTLTAAELLMFASTGPINSAIVNYVSPKERSSAIALSVLAIHLLGDVPSPALIGAVSDATSLGRAVLIVPVGILAGGVIWSFAAFRMESD